MDNSRRIAQNLFAVRFVALVNSVLFLSCLAEPVYESEGPYRVNLVSSSDSCSKAWMTMVIDDLPYPGPRLGGFYLPRSFSATEGSHTIGIYCMNRRIGSTSDIVWIDTIEIVSDTSFVLDCVNCEIEP